MVRRRVVLLLLLLVPTLSARDKFQAPEGIRLTRGGEKWAERTVKEMSLEEKIGQMFMLKAPAQFLNLESPEYINLRQAVDRYHIGGFLLTVRAENGAVYRNQPYEAAMFTNYLQRESELPLIFAADFERGLSTRFDATTAFPHAMAFAAAGKPEYVEAFARIVAQEARAIGVSWNFFPVADVNSNPVNPIINTRAFSEDAQQAGALAAAYIRTSRQFGLLTTAKHFPGHGDTSTDSHVEAARVTGDRTRLESVELKAFRSAFEAGVDTVMVGHMNVPALDPEPRAIASVSKPVITGLLKQQMKFDGLVVPDAMDMAALTRLYPASAGLAGRAAVDAVKAGNDMVLLPTDIDASYNALLDAVRSGEIPVQQIDASVLKILKLKASVGLDKARLVDVHALSRLIARPENLAVAQQVADEAVTLVRENGRVLPLSPAPAKPPQPSAAAPNGTPAQAPAYVPEEEEKPRRLAAIIFTDDLRSEYGRLLDRELRRRVPGGVEAVFVDGATASAMSERVYQAVERADVVVAAVFVTPTAGKRVRGTQARMAGIPDSHAALLRGLLERARSKTVVVAMGSPYLAGDFPEVENYLCTFSGVQVSEMSAVKALFGEIPIRGKMPVTVPNIAERGSGIEVPVRTAPTTQAAAPTPVFGH
jgi:beta-N-acetylhexosaminidase